MASTTSNLMDSIENPNGRVSVKLQRNYFSKDSSVFSSIVSSSKLDESVINSIFIALASDSSISDAVSVIIIIFTSNYSISLICDIICIISNYMS